MLHDPQAGLRRLRESYLFAGLSGLDLRFRFRAIIDSRHRLRRMDFDILRHEIPQFNTNFMNM
jgi:hypothetical protein